MNNFLGILSKRTTKTNAVNMPLAAQSQQQAKFDFVEKYVLVDPKKLLINYECWAYCNTFPVAIENSEDKYGWKNSVQLPTKIFLDYLLGLKKAPIEVSQNPIMRTVYKIRLQNNEQMYIFPDPKQNPLFVVPDNYTLPFHVTPQINRAIVDCWKTFTR